jgi:RNA polymerase sigma factor (sigma-70 family)
MMPVRAVATDPELLTAWRGGDAASGEALFSRYYTAIARFFANKVATDPADLIQETFVGCLHGRDRIEDPERFRAYVFGIAYNVLRQHYRRRHVDGERLDFESASVADLGAGPVTWMVESGEQLVLLQALRRIPLQFQVVLELFYWEDLTSAAIASVLGEPHGTVRTRLRRARELLAQEIGRVDAEPELRRRTLSDLDGWAEGLRSAPLSAGPPSHG